MNAHFFSEALTSNPSVEPQGIRLDHVILLPGLKATWNLGPFFFSFFFWLHHVACGILVPGPGIKPAPRAVVGVES